VENPEKTFHWLGIVIMSLSASGMLGHAYGLLASLLYQLPWFSEIQAFPLNGESLTALMTKARFYFVMQLAAHGLLYAAAFRIMKFRESGRWLLNAGVALIILLIVLLPLSFPAVQITENPEAVWAYKQIRSQIITMSILWLLVWAGMVYYVNRDTFQRYFDKTSQS
jgi:magnesium-transporting ATPase (P-type)